MAVTPYFMQTGMGADLHGCNDTKAACKDVNDAIQNNNMLFLRHAGLQSLDQLLVDVAIATPHPDELDIDIVAAEFPVGTITIKPQLGGMLVDSDVSDDPVLIAVASVTVSTKT